MTKYPSLLKITLAGTILLAFTSCSGITHIAVPLQEVPIGSEPPAARKARLESDLKSEEAVDGIRYYRSSLYVLINSNGKGGIEWRLLELPDQTKLMSAKPYDFVASLNTTMHFDGGVLRQSHEAADGTIVPRAAIEAGAKIAAAAAKLFAMLVQQSPKEHEIHLYKLVPTDDGIALVGGPGSPKIKVTLDPER